MGIVEEFIDRYRREQDFYEQAARLVAQALESRVQAEGIRAIVTYRAKSVTRLEPKVKARACRKSYESVDDIYRDIIDLAGARVALYFPGQRDQVGRLIEELFFVLENRKFPDQTQPRYKKRFTGYAATHFRVRLKESSLPDHQKRYADARVEIQLASVLMHAWSEVEHDLVYKPLQGELSIDEYSVLDELNGLVIAGELALERLQRAGESRVTSAGHNFSNHYELATHLLREGATGLPAELANAALGRVDVLFEFLSRLNLASPDALKPYLENLHQDFERRPLAEQVIDQLLLQDESRYQLYESVRAARPSSELTHGNTITEEPSRNVTDALGVFLAAWIELERFIREHAPPSMQYDPKFPTWRILDRLVDLEPSRRQEFERVRRMRNNAVHGVEMPPIPDLIEAAAFLRDLRASLESTA